MIPVYEHTAGSKNGYEYGDFLERFLEICNQQLADNRGLVFALILYDFEAPQVAKVLRDPDYWRALDRVSGSFITVFSFHHSPRSRRAILDDDDWQDPGDRTQALLQKHFEIPGPLPTPCLIFFQVDNQNVIESYVVSLRKNTIETAFNEIREVLAAAAASVSEVTDENRANIREIFMLVSNKLKRRALYARLKRIGRTTKAIAEIVTMGG